MLPRKCRWMCVALCCGLAVGCVSKPIYRNGGVQVGGRKSVKKLPQIVAPGPAAHSVDPNKINTDNAYQVGVASYYGKKFHGRKTANGEVFNMYKLTAAHRVLPLGTHVKVTNLKNGRWVEVKVNDRGPFIEGRILDLSFAAALELEMIKQGTAKVMIEITKPVE